MYKPIEITRKEAEHLTDTIYDIWDISEVTFYLKHKYYNQGIYGWNYSLYQDLEGNYYIDSYRNTPRNVKKLDYNKTIKYKDRIKEIYKSRAGWDNNKIKIQEVLNDFIDEIKKEEA